MDIVKILTHSFTALITFYNVIKFELILKEYYWIKTPLYNVYRIHEI